MRTGLQQYKTNGTSTISKAVALQPCKRKGERKSQPPDLTQESERGLNVEGKIIHFTMDS
jgi:hypothetical protein